MNTRQAGASPVNHGMPLRPTFLSTAAWRVVNVLSSVAANLLALRLFGEYLPRGVFGVVTVAMVLLGYLPLLDGGFRLAINRELLVQGPGGEQRRLVEFGQTLYALMTAVAAVAAVALLGLYAVTPAARSLGLPLGFFIAIAIAGSLSFAAQAQANLLIGLGEQRRLFALNAMAAWLNLSGLWVGFRLGWGIWAFPAALAFSALTVDLLALVAARRILPGLKPLGSGFGADFGMFWSRLKSRSLAALRNQVFTALLYSVDPIFAFYLSSNVSEAERYAATFRVLVIIRGLLQAADESMWPRVTEDRIKGIELSRALCRANAWMHGAVMGAVAVTLTPFLAAYVQRPDWIPGVALVSIMAARSLITGVCSQPAYFLYGDGQFGRLSRGMGSELALAVLLSIPLGWKFGAMGVAVGFLLSTVAGTFFPIPRMYARATGQPFGAWLSAVWWRAILATSVAASAGAWLIHRGGGLPWVIGSGMLAVFLALCLAGAYALRPAGVPGNSWRNLVNRF